MSAGKTRTKDEKIKLIVKGSVFGVMIALMIAATIAFIPFIKLLGTDEGMAQLLEFIDDKGAFGVLIYIGIQALQVIIPLIPPIQIIGGVLFGSVLGSIYSCIGIYLGMSIVFVLVRIFGYPLVEALVDGKDLKKFSFLEDSAKVEIIFFILYFIPGMPKDTLSFVAPLTNVKPKNYFLYVLPARFPLMILAAVFGAAVRDQSYTFAVILCIIMIDLGIFGILFRDKILAAIQGLKPTDNVEKTKKAMYSMIRWGVYINFFAALMMTVISVLCSTDAYSCGAVDFVKTASFSSFDNLLYFCSHYGMYFCISLVVVGTVSILSGYIRQKNFDKMLKAKEAEENVSEQE